MLNLNNDVSPTERKIFNSAMYGLNTLSTWGDMITALDSVLVTGFNDRVCNKYDIIDNNGVLECVLHFNDFHGYVNHQVLLLSGDNINGEFRVIDSKTDKVILVLHGYDGTVGNFTDNLNVMVAPLGFKKVFEGEHKGVYQSNSPTSNKMLLRVDNSKSDKLPEDYNGAIYSRVAVYDYMTDVDTYNTQNFAPNFTPYDDGGFFGSNSSNTGMFKWFSNIKTAKRQPISAKPALNVGWSIIGDSKSFYWHIQYSINNISSYCFVEYNSYSNNNFNILVNGVHDIYPYNNVLYNDSNNTYVSSSKSPLCKSNSANGERFIMKADNYFGHQQYVDFVVYNTDTSLTTISANNNVQNTLFTQNNDILLSSVLIKDKTNKIIVGDMPMLNYILGDGKLPNGFIINKNSLTGNNKIYIANCSISLDNLTNIAYDLGSW